MSTFLRWEAIEELNIYGGRSALERVHDLLYGVVLRGKIPPMPLRLHEIGPGRFFESENFSVTAFPVTHRGPDCLGYLFEGKARRPFLPERAEALGIPSGPERRRLVEGETLTLADGRRVTPDDVLGPLQRGARLAVVGDAARTDNLVEFVQQADGLVIESTYLDADAELAREFGHLTARQAAELAVRANVGRLVLTHISRRYREKEVLEEAQAVFPHVSVARDFDVFQFKAPSA